jgi:copper chaperone CopZ
MNKLFTFKMIAIEIIAIALFTANVKAIDKDNRSEIKIKTSAYSWECKNVIESNVNNLLGVIESNLDLASKVLTVKIDNSKISCDSIINTIKKLGYDAEVLCKDVIGNKVSKDVKDGKSSKDSVLEHNNQY